MTWLWALAALGAHPQLALKVDPCVEVSATELRTLLAIKLGRPLQAETELTAPLRAEAGCDGELVALTLADASGRTVATRRVDLRTAPPKARARVLALALTELLEPSERGPRAPELEPPALPLEEPLPTLSLAAWGGLLSFFGSGQRLNWVGGLELGRYVFGSLFELGVGLAVHGTRARTPLGLTTLTAASVSVSARVVKRMGFGVSVSAGLGGRMGAAFLSGWPVDASVQGSTLVRPWGGPMALARAAYFVSQPVGLVLEGEAGWAIGGIAGLVEGVNVIGLGGLWLTGKAGVAISW